MSDFLRRTQDAEATEAFNNSSWDKLQAEADQAWEAYKKHKDAKRNWRRPFEAIDYAAEKAMTSCCIEFLLELVPDGDYTSLLSGGLTLVYNVSKLQIRLLARKPIPVKTVNLINTGSPAEERNAGKDLGTLRQLVRAGKADQGQYQAVQP